MKTKWSKSTRAAAMRAAGTALIGIGVVPTLMGLRLESWLWPVLNWSAALGFVLAAVGQWPVKEPGGDARPSTEEKKPEPK